MRDHECTFVEEQESNGRLILAPCLECNAPAMQALTEIKELLNGPLKQVYDDHGRCGTVADCVNWLADKARNLEADLVKAQADREAMGAAYTALRDAVVNFLPQLLHDDGCSDECVALTTLVNNPHPGTPLLDEIKGLRERVKWLEQGRELFIQHDPLCPQGIPKTRRVGDAPEPCTCGLADWLANEPKGE